MIDISKLPEATIQFDTDKPVPRDSAPVVMVDGEPVAYLPATMVETSHGPAEVSTITIHLLLTESTARSRGPEDRD